MVDDNNDHKEKDKNNLVAYRVPPNVLPIYQDIAKALYVQGTIKRPDITSLSKLSLNWFASAYIQQQQQALARQHAEMVGARSAVASSTSSSGGFVKEDDS